MTTIQSAAWFGGLADLEWNDNCPPPDPNQTKYETALIMVSVDRDFLAKCEDGTYTFDNRAVVKDRMMELTRNSIARYERIIAAHRAGQSITDL